MNESSLLSFSETNGKAVIVFLTSIGLADTDKIKQEVRSYLKVKPYAEVVFRMDRVHYLDSSGLGLFVTLLHEFRATSRFRFSGLRPNVRLVFEFSNLLHYFSIDDAGNDEIKVVDPPMKPAKPDSHGRQEFLAVEGKYILTEDGVKYCAQKQIPVQDLRLYRGATVSGFTWTSVNSGLLERFVTHGLLAGMELERTEFVEKREQILRLTEVLFDGIAMKRFRPLLKMKLMENETYRRLVAQSVSPTRLRAALQQHSATIAGLKAEIEDLVAARSAAARARTAQLLNLVDDSVWFLLVQAQSAAGNRILRQIVLDAVVAYSGRLELSSMIALNLMEFLQQAERAHFLNLAERDLYTRKNPQTIPELLADPSFRERLVEKAKRQNEYLVMNMNFDGNPHGVGGLVVEITVRNKGVAGNSRRTESLGKRSARPPGRSLEEAYVSESSEGNLEDLSLLNLNALKLLCREQGIGIETGLTRDERSDETVAFMKLVL